VRRLFKLYRRVPIRWRLAGGSAVLTMIILCGFAVIVGVLTTRQIRSDFHEQVNTASDQVAREIDVRPGRNPPCVAPGSAESAEIRVVTLDGTLLCKTSGAPDFGLPRPGAIQTDGYRVEARPIRVPPLGEAIVQYGRPYSDIEHTENKVRVFLTLGVLGGTLLALLAGLATARRAIRPVAQLTSVAREIERTRDPSLRVPHPEADDEVAELARTLEGMLQALDEARAQTEATLERQRTFVADASHELRTPLTSVLANLELLSVQLEESDLGDAADGALRSAQRMRRLVADLLLLARADAGRTPPRTPTDVGAVVTEAAAELEPISDGHAISVDANEPAMVSGTRDDLHRLVGNLIENAIRHTPEGTSIAVSVHAQDGEVELVVEDDGPGIPPDLAAHVFERFVRGGADRTSSTSSGLGLAIVAAVAQSHGGNVRLESGENGGARFVVRLPADSAPVAEPEAVGA
jgi:two-component system OmpR family sensor kinase